MCSDVEHGYPSGDITAQLARLLVDTQFPRWSSLAISPVPHQGVDNRTFRLPVSVYADETVTATDELGDEDTRP